MAFEKQDIYTLAIMAMFITIFITLPISFYEISTTYKDNPQDLIGLPIGQLFIMANTGNALTGVTQTYTAPQITCPINEPACENGLSTSTSIQNTGFDVIQTKINWGTIMTVILWMTARAALLPITLVWFFYKIPVVQANPFLGLLITALCTIWQIALIGTIFKWIFKR